ncbi:MAG: hypothetical protein P8X88_09170, partial [Gammaproteobacteria bacterium]
MNNIKIIKIIFDFILIGLFCIVNAQASNFSLETIAIYEPQSGCEATEIVSIQNSTKRLALSCS